MKKNLLILSSVLVVSAFSANSQCAFTGLDSSYCVTDNSSVLTIPGSGTLSGPGISGTTFDPAMAGPGTHTITYSDGDPNLYTVDQGGTYAPVAGSGTSVILGDDEVSTALPIGFNFLFFGNTYTDFYISSNGFMTFTSTFDSGCCSGGLLPTNTTPDNLIAFCWDDMYPPGNGTIEYFTTGTAPYRMLIMNFTDIPFCCGSNPEINTQVILYETTNIIEIHTTYATAFSSGTQGIQNVGGTIGFSVPGRNSASWTPFTNDYVAFIPSLCTYAQVVDVFPTPSITLSANDEMFGNDGSINLTINSGIAPFTFDWDNDGLGDNDDSNDLFGVPAGTYTVYMTDASGCTINETITIGSQVGLEELAGLDFTIEPNPSTGIFNVVMAEGNTYDNVQLLIVNTLGQRIVEQKITSAKTEVNMAGNPAGVYYVKLVTASGVTVKQIVIK